MSTSLWVNTDTHTCTPEDSLYNDDDTLSSEMLVSALQNGQSSNVIGLFMINIEFHLLVERHIKNHYDIADCMSELKLVWNLYVLLLICP